VKVESAGKREGDDEGRHGEGKIIRGESMGFLDGEESKEKDVGEGGRLTGWPD